MRARSKTSTGPGYGGYRTLMHKRRGRSPFHVLCALVLVTLMLPACARGQQTPTPPQPEPASTASALEGQPTPGSVPTATVREMVTPTPLPVREPDEALLAIGDLVDEEGRLPVNVAMEIFAGHVAPLPGVSPRRLPGDSGERAAEVAIQVLVRNLDQIPPDAAAAVEQAMFGVIEEEIEIPPRGIGTGEPELVERLAGVLMPAARAQGSPADLRHLVEEVRGRIESRSGLRLRVPVRVATARSLPGDIVAVASPVVGEGRVAACRVVFETSSLDDPVELEYFIAHEVWHCFQYDHAGTRDRGPWVDEGQAEWVATEVASDPSSAAGSWATWLGAPHRSLWSRSYDAVGLYAAAHEAGYDPFSAMIVMYRLGNEEAVSRLFGGIAYQDALRFVAMGLVRAPALGDEWEAEGRGIPATRGTTLFAISSAAQQAEIDAGAFGSLPLELRVEGDGELLQLLASGEGAKGVVEFPGVGPLQVTPGQQLTFCLIEGGCACPDGSDPGGGEAPPVLQGRSGVATVASARGGTIALTARLLDGEEACRRLVGTWVTTVQAVSGALTAPYGGVPNGIPCQGPYTLTFAPDGAFAASFDAVCQGRSGRLVHGTGRTEGRYEDFGDSFVVLDSRATAVMQIEGLSMPVLDVFTNMTAPTHYVIEGNVLTISFTTPDGHLITLQFTRAE